MARPLKTAEPLTEEQQALAARFVPLARKIARRYLRKHCGEDRAADVESDALLALVDAASRYDGRVRFTTFAWWRIHGEIINGLNPDRRRRVKDPRGVPMRYEPEDRVDLMAGVDADDAFDGLIGRLPARLALVVSLTYRDGLSRDEVGARLGCTGSNASRLLTRALQRLTEELRDDDRGSGPDDRVAG
jgi:RNA polymerase sigma factor (sigma-70 family)